MFYNQFRKIFPDIDIESQKRFNWLGKQSLDFYLPKYNIAIEYQGRQHFEKVEKFHNKESFEVQLERDKTKKQLCEENGVKLIYFTFDKKFKSFLGEKVYNDIIEFDFIN